MVVSDLHAMDRLAPLPEHFELLNKEVVEPNPIQRGLNRAYNSLAKEWHEPDLLISLGDATGGQDRKQAGTTVISTQPLDQLNAAANLLERFKARKTIIIRGSSYHVSVNGLPIEEALAEKLKAIPIGTGNMRSGLKFILEKFGLRIHFAHHLPTSQTEWFLPTPGAKEGIRLQLQIRKLGHMDAIFRGHSHYFYYQRRRQIIVNCPCWVFPGDFLHKKSGEPLTDIGAVRFVLTDKPDELGKQIHVQEQLFPIEEANTRVVTV